MDEAAAPNNLLRPISHLRRTTTENDVSSNTILHLAINLLMGQVSWSKRKQSHYKQVTYYRHCWLPISIAIVLDCTDGVRLRGFIFRQIFCLNINLDKIFCKDRNMTLHFLTQFFLYVFVWYPTQLACRLIYWVTFVSVCSA